jgi:hypothetical protein
MLACTWIGHVKGSIGMDERNVYDTSGAARYLGMSTWWVIKDRRTHRKVPYTRIGRKYIYLKADLDAFLQAGRVSPASFHGNKKDE